ncbi:hypothetical protein OCU04_001999 [Sclerotinia nivalis]|uniref:Uncharacterized protein n=1 Tax=Sclerotinia nivalis TaxID=352851 RepID=A0A9X0AZQ1_9HELO|nr:hypothetical protein OCU04_001999 [Sclerotinia nivalis]
MKGEDKLPALSTIAHEYHQRLKTARGKYLAGLWMEDFLSQILWFSEVWKNSKRPSCYFGPSWLWASVNGIVSYPSGANNGPFSLDVLHVSTDLDEINPFGKVKGGGLTSREFTRTAKIYQNGPVCYVSHYLRSLPYGWELDLAAHYEPTIYLDTYKDAT